MTPQQTFGVIVTSRNIFPAALATAERKCIRTKLESLGFGVVMLDEEAVPHGAVETYQDAQACANLFKAHREIIDGIIVILPNFGDEQGVVQAIDLADLRIPILVQACNEETTTLTLGKRRDSFCGKLSVCNNLYQFGIPFTNTTLHTCKVDSDVFTTDLQRFAGVCRVVRGLHKVRIGAIGARPEAFNTVRFSEKLFQASGIKVVTVDLSDIYVMADAIAADSPDIKNHIQSVKAYGTLPQTVPEDQLLKQARFSLAVNRWMAENDCAASAIQCWTSIQNNYGCASCLSMSMMGEDGKPSACEMDIAGAVSMLALNLASGGVPSGFVDWNNNYLEEQDKCVVTHCSNYPKSFMGTDIELSHLDVLGEALGQDHCWAGIKGRVAPGDFTYTRISTDDTEGIIKAYVGEGRFTDDPLICDGGVAVCAIPDLQNLLDYLCQNGFEHHVAMNRSLCAEVIEEAFVTYLGWDVYRHI